MKKVAANLVAKRQSSSQASSRPASPRCCRSGSRRPRRRPPRFAQDKQEYTELTQERANVEQRIAVRIAKASEVALKAAAERAAEDRRRGRRQPRSGPSARPTGQALSGPSSGPRRSKRRTPPPPRRRAARARATISNSKDSGAASYLEVEERLGSSSSGSKARPGAPATDSVPGATRRSPRRTGCGSRRSRPEAARWHSGAEPGQSIRAPYSGKVVEKSDAGYGNADRLLRGGGRPVRHHRLQPRDPLHRRSRRPRQQGRR